MSNKIDAIIFDFDGVIVDSGDDIVNAVQYTLKEFGHPMLSKDEIIGYVGHGAEKLIRWSFKDGSEETIKKALPFYKSYYLQNAIVKTKLYENVKITLEKLKSGMKKTALVTNKPEELAYRILEGLEVREYFDLVIGPESVSRMKPDPEGIVKVLNEFGVEPCRALMVGDSHTDIEAGKSAGTYTCAVTYGLGDKKELAGSQPDFSIDNMIELMEHIY